MCEQSRTRKGAVKQRDDDGFPPDEMIRRP